MSFASKTIIKSCWENPMKQNKIKHNKSSLKSHSMLKVFNIFLKWKDIHQVNYQVIYNRWKHLLVFPIAVRISKPCVSASCWIVSVYKKQLREKVEVNIFCLCFSEHWTHFKTKWEPVFLITKKERPRCCFRKDMWMCMFFRCNFQFLYSIKMEPETL